MRGNTGQALIEMAIVLPLLIMMFLGIFDFGRVMYWKNTLNNTARVGARAAAVKPSPFDLPESAPNLSSPLTDLQRLMKTTLPDNVAGNVTFLVERVDETGTVIPGTVVVGDGVKVTLSWQKFPMMLLPYTLNLQGTALMRYEQRP